MLATNTLHKVASLIVEAISVPFLHILDAVAGSIKAKGLTTIALLGTAFTMSDNFYVDGLRQRGITPLVPDEQAQ